MGNSKMTAGRFLRWHEARRKLEWVRARCAEGKTVYLQTMARAIKIGARQVGNLAATKSGLYLASGSSRVCVSYCRLSAH